MPVEVREVRDAKRSGKAELSAVLQQEAQGLAKALPSRAYVLAGHQGPLHRFPWPCQTPHYSGGERGEGPGSAHRRALRPGSRAPGSRGYAAFSLTADLHPRDGPSHLP